MLCQKHYMQKWYREQHPEAKIRVKPQKGACAVPDCGIGTDRISGLCPKHDVRARKYGLSAEEIIAWLAIELCQACGNPPLEGRILHIDHDHSTGLVRGMLCNGCNTALGLLQEDIARIRGLEAYLSELPG
jgi:hypothetical protein